MLLWRKLYITLHFYVISYPQTVLNIEKEIRKLKHFFRVVLHFFSQSL